MSRRTYQDGIAELIVFVKIDDHDNLIEDIDKSKGWKDSKDKEKRRNILRRLLIYQPAKST